MSFKAANGYAVLGMWQECWDALDEMAPDKRHTRPALRLRLLCCARLDAWILGAEIAGYLEEGLDRDKEAAACFYHALAVRELTDGRRDAAKNAIELAIDAWPQIRIALLDDTRLEALF